MRTIFSIHRPAALMALVVLVLACPGLASAQVSFTTLHTFTGASSSIVLSPLIQGTDGNFYGTTSTEGAAGVGTIYRMTPGGTDTVLHEFAGGSADGATPLAALLQAKDGNFYGTTSAGGASNLGTVFRMTPGGSVTILHSFAGGSADGSSPRAALIQGTDGNFYGTTFAGGSLDLGTVFRMTPSGTTVLLHSFTGAKQTCNTNPSNGNYPCPSEDTDGRNPTAALLQAADGNFYGTTTRGGGYSGPPSCCNLALDGTIFRMAPDGTVTTLHSFPAGTSGLTFLGTAPTVPLIQASDGDLYGTTQRVGLSDSGYAFRLTLDGTFTVLTGGGALGERSAALTQATDGNFYGVFTRQFDPGALFQMTRGGVLTTLHNTAKNNQNGSSLLQAADGTFYGTLGYGRLNDGSTVAPSVFQLSAGLPPPVAGPPSITTQPSSQAVRAGQQAVFIAAANSLPAPLYQWQVSSDSGGTWTNVVDGSSYSGTSASQLSIMPPTRALDGYQFRVVATNSYGTATSNTASLTVQPKSATDFDDDGRADLPILRPSTGFRFVKTSTGSPFHMPQSFGTSGDVPVPGDYDGDGVADVAVWRPSTGVWFVHTSNGPLNVYQQYQWGASTDIPVPGDYDGDGKADLAIFRPSTAIWHIAESSSNYTTMKTLALGLSTDIPVPADYDDDGTTDIAVFRPATGMWTIRNSATATAFSIQWGALGDVPVPGDYDDDGNADLAVWRPSNGVWYLKLSASNFTTAVSHQWGTAGDIPAPADYDGDGATDPAVFRPASGTWWILNSATASASVTQWGTAGDQPAPNAPVAYALAAAAGKPTVSTLANVLRFGNMDGDGKVDLTVWRPSSGTWFTAQSGANYTTSATVQWGLATDIPVAGDYDGDGETDAAVYRPSTGVWYLVQSSTNLTTSTSIQLGLTGDVPVPGDYDGDGKADVAVYRPSTGLWDIAQSGSDFTTSVSYQWGASGDVTVPGDYDGDGLTDLAVYRPSTGVWYVLQSATNYTTSVAFQWGASSDITVPGDYDGDGRTDLAVYRPSTGIWFIKQSNTGYTTSVSFLFGLGADVPVPGEYDGDGKTDIAVWRPSTGEWFILQSSTSFTTSSSLQWGASGDIPILGRQ